MGEGADIVLPPAPGKVVPAMLGAVLWTVWWLAYWGQTTPLAPRDIEVLREGRVVQAREVRCGFRPRAYIEEGGQRIGCGGVRCPVRGPVFVVVDPRDPHRCIAQAALADAPRRERQWKGALVLGTAAGALGFGVALAVFLARVQAGRAFYRSEAWRQYKAIRDGESRAEGRASARAPDGG